MKRRAIHVFLLLISFCACRSAKTPGETTPPFNATATYTPYTTALGAAHAILFRIRVTSSLPDLSWNVDSLYIGGYPKRIGTMRQASALMVEYNYLQTNPEPVAAPDGHMIRPPDLVPNNFPDEAAFYPAWIVLSSEKKSWRLPVKFIEVKTPPN